MTAETVSSGCPFGVRGEPALSGEIEDPRINPRFPIELRNALSFSSCLNHKLEDTQSIIQYMDPDRHRGHILGRRGVREHNVSGSLRNADRVEIRDSDTPVQDANQGVRMDLPEGTGCE